MKLLWPNKENNNVKYLTCQTIMKCLLKEKTVGEWQQGGKGYFPQGWLSLPLLEP